MVSLLAVDVGLRTGLALYGQAGRLCWYRSRKLSKTVRLKRVSHRLLVETPDLAWLVLEGGGSLAELWQRQADRLGISVLPVCAEIWRKDFFYPRERSSGALAKRHACKLARRVITWSGAPGPTSLRHDTAEAILIGLWGVKELGWIEDLPEEIRK